MDQNGSFPGETAGNGNAAKCGLSVYAAAPGTVPAPTAPECSGPVSQDGLTGSLALQNLQSLNQDEAATVLSRLDHLIRWAQAQQAKTLTRIHTQFRTEYHQDTATLDPAMAFSLAAEEAAAILHIPTNTAMMLMSEAGTLCTTHTPTLHALETGNISYAHAQTVIDQCQNIPAKELPSFQTQLLDLAPEQTHTQFRVRARRLRENTYPETIVVRQRSAFEQRRVALQPDCDGMSWLSALLPAEKAQAFFTRLSLAARGEQAHGDPRTVDQLRTDILTDLLDGGNHGATCEGDCPRASAGKRSGAGRSGGSKTGTGCGGHGSRARTEILVLISAETLLGADDQPAELHGYGPISPETARRMAREAAKWTPVERNPDTEEVLRVGKRRKVPDGLKQLLRVRDGTCRFPGCRTNAVISEIDHTKPWAQGGVTDHDNLEHLCRRHHMFKTKGFWKACQPSPGIIEWTSPGGRKYRTEPRLALTQDTEPAPPVPAPPVPAPSAPAVAAPAPPIPTVPALAPPDAGDPDDYGDDPPPF
ncbi:HNH endonuclease signature motif containing protein [Arthrobacter sp. G119Y2]|uniref:HNH endonuclease signature motif containing protein n=1 Tax=Arthrobacter sp. G119Y2 TaxID=3134965 RepID=UPI003119958E